MIYIKGREYKCQKLFMMKRIENEHSILTNSSQAISMIGTMLVQYAIIWHVTLSTQSGTMVGLMSALGILPMIVVMPFAGALADHYNRKKSLFYLIVALRLLLCSW